MARSTNIYVVKTYPARSILGCFTVKHEMVSSLYQLTRERISVYRYKDGFLNNAYLLAEGQVKDVLRKLDAGEKCGRC